MITAGLPSLAILLLALSAYGWGRLARFFGTASLIRFHSLTVVLGLGVLHVLGGLLNLASIATRPVLMTLMLIGAIVTAVELRRHQPWKSDLRLLRKSRRSPTGLFLSFLPLLFALIATCAAFSLLVPTTVFNSGDDFHTYVTRVIRMAQTGSLAGTPFDMQGLDGQGSQSFFQAFFTDGTLITALNCFDAVFCFGLSLCVIAEASLRWRVPPALGILAVATIVIVNPQYVNISPLYSGALFIIALLLSSAAIIRKLGATPPRRRWQNELTLALIAAPLFTLKVPLALFAALFLLGLFLFLNLTQSNRKQLIKPAFVILGALALFVVPWVLTHLPTLLHTRALGTGLAAQAPLASAYGSMAAGDVAKLLTNTRSTYGDTFLAFDFLVLACIALGATAAWLLLRQPPKTPALLVTVTIGITIPLAYFLNAFLFPVETAVRYSSPMLIAALAAGLLCLARPVDRAALVIPTSLLGANACLILIALVWFLPTFQSRLAVARKYHTLVSYQISDGYAQYSTTLASPEQSGFYRALQKGTRPGHAILAWTIAPFHLDFARNPILTVSEQGLTNPQILFPAGADPAALESYLRNLGVRYVMVETGAGTAKDSAYLRTVATSQDIMFKKLGDYCLYFRESLFAMSKHHNTLFQNDRLLIFELKDPPSP